MSDSDEEERVSVDLLQKNMSVSEETVVWTEARFPAVDYVLFSSMLVVSLGIGVYSGIKSRGKESTQEYLLGSRSMLPFPVALSLLGGVVSAISVLGNSTEVYLYGTQLCVTLLGYIPGCVVVHQILLPILYNLKLVSLNQYIQLRYNSRILRQLSSLCHLLSWFFFMGICLYAPSLALSTFTSLSPWASVIIMGAICTFYITVGGVRAVVYTDVVQTVLMFTGVLVVVVMCCSDLGGVTAVWDVATNGSRIQFFNLDPSPFVRYTFWSTSVLCFYQMISLVGLSQASYQRFASINSLITVRRLCVFFVVGLWALWGLFYFSGLVAFAAYQDCDPLTSGRIQKPDQIIPFLVMNKLGHLAGLPGVFVAAVYGGVLSSLSSYGNSIACLIWEDFLKDRPYFSRLTTVAATTILKLLSVAAGASSILLGLLAGELGNIFMVINSISGSVMGPMQGVFLAGMCAPWVTSKGAVVGFVSAFSYNMVVVVGKFLRGGGSPTRLPLSTDGCPENYLTLTNTTLAAHNSPLTPGESGTHTLFDVSYCYLGVTGILITFVVSSLASLCTGTERPGAVDARLVSPSCARLHRWLWRLSCGHNTPTTQDASHQVAQLVLQADTMETPLVLQADNTQTPLVLQADNTQTPLVLQADTVQTPLVLQADTKQTPLVLQTDTTETPLVLQADNTQTPLVLQADTTETPLVLQADNTQTPLVLQADTTQAPLVLQADTTETPLVLQVNTARMPLVLQADTTETPHCGSYAVTQDTVTLT